MSKKNRKPNSSAGFTLVEVMVALTVVAVAMGALLEGMASFASYHGALRERFWSQNVAWNQLSKIIVAQEVGGLKSISGGGSEKQLGANWKWDVEQEDTASDTIIRLDMRVNPEGTDEGTRLTTMIMRGGGFNRSQLEVND